MTNIYGKKGDIGRTEVQCVNLQKLAEAYFYNEEIVLQLAIGVSNLIAAYSSQGYVANAEARYADLQKLAGIYPHNEEMILQQANGAYNLTTYYSTKGNMIMAEAHYAELQRMAKFYPHKEEIVLQHAMGAGSQLYFASEQEKIKHKTYFLSLLEELESLVTAYGQAESWQETLPLLLRARDDNQWLKA